MIDEYDLTRDYMCDYVAKKCAKQACYILSGHFLDVCATPLGMMLCSEHTAITLQTYGLLLPATCESCNVLFESLHDLIDVSHIVKGLRI